MHFQDVILANYPKKMFQIKWQIFFFLEVCPLLNIISRQFKQTSESVF